MRRSRCVPWLAASVLLGSAVMLPGCAGSSTALTSQVQQLRQQNLALTGQKQQLQQRADSLDQGNRELHQQIAQSDQQTKVTEDQLAAVRDQLRGVTGQLAESRQGKLSSDHKVEALTASMRRRGGVSITPNNSLLQTLPAISQRDVHVRRDGDVIRVALPGAQLFESGSARLRPGAAALIGTAAAEILRIYPDQVVGVEGHTDSDPVTGSQWRNNHELSTGRAMAVQDLLVTRTRFESDQLYIVGHGPNRPIASNATLDGKKHNRRIELVIHPRKRGQ